MRLVMRLTTFLALLAAVGAAVPALAAGQTMQVATFSGGCFWSMQKAFDHLKGKGVVATEVGYSGGTVANPTYREVSTGTTGHLETINVTYDPAQISYTRLARDFFQFIDPTDPNGQFCDQGYEYHTAIFYHNTTQEREADKIKQALTKAGMPVVTAVRPFMAFYPAEAYHQEFYLKNPAHYMAYRYGCGRDKALAKVWAAYPKAGQSLLNPAP